MRVTNVNGVDGAAPFWTAYQRVSMYAVRYPDGSWNVRVSLDPLQYADVEMMHPPIPEGLALQLFPYYQTNPLPYKDLETLEEV